MSWKHIHSAHIDNVDQEWVSRLVRQWQKSQYNYTELRNQKGLLTEGRKSVLSMEGKCAQSMRDNEHGWLKCKTKMLACYWLSRERQEMGWSEFHSLILEGVGLRWSVGLGIWSPMSRLLGIWSLAMSRCLDRKMLRSFSTEGKWWDWQTRKLKS